MLSICILVFGLFLIGRLYIVQIVKGEEFTYRADRQYIRPSQSLFDRGNIFFTTKNGEHVSAATLKTGYVVSINPSILANPEDVYSKLSTIIEIDPDDFYRKVAKSTDPYEEIADRVPQNLADQIQALGIGGVGVYKEKWRYYPGDQMAAQTLGLVAYSGDELAGRYGLERYYEQVLGRNKSDVYVNFFAEIFSNIKKTISYSQAREGNIVTSIEPTVQAFLHQKLITLQETWPGDLVGAIIMDPRNGEIIAMDSLPTFNPNDLSEVEDISVFANPLVENVYEMGSIVKPLTLAAGIDTGVVTINTTYYDAGYLVLNGLRIENYDGQGRGTVDMQEVINHSLNTGAAFIESRLGNQTFTEYMTAYGLRDPSGIDLPNDTTGLTSNLDSPRDIEHATASYGQGIAITPMAITRALAVLANGGKLVTPHVVREIDPDVGLAKKVEYDTKRVIKESTAEEISRVLTVAVDEALLGGTVSLDRYSVAAKTGTAQIASSNGGYSEYESMHTFFGYFPSYDARFIVFFFDKNPRGARYASETLTYPFMDITQFLINYYDIPPDR